MYSKHLIDVEYIKLNLKQQGLKLGKCQPYKLYNLDQDHFLGINGTKKCIQKMRINSNDIVLDIGSGFGGVSRFIANKTGAKVVGVEIQKDRCAFAVNVTKKSGLDDKVSFICEDFVSTNLDENGYTKIVAILSILHFLDKQQALRKAAHVLKKNGLIYIEDYYKSKSSFTRQENEKLLKIISCPNLFLKKDYLSELEKQGIKILSVDDLTKTWKTQASLRFDDMRMNIKPYRVKYGEAKALKAFEFALGVSELLDSGIIHGFRIIGKKIK